MRIPIDTVLLVVGVQPAADDPIRGPRNNADAEERIAALLATWRECGMPVIHIRHAAEPDSPCRPEAPGDGFRPGSLPLPGERVLARSTGSAFVGTLLEETLTAGGHTTLVVCGALTQGAIETTVRHAGCLGFRVFVPEDACWAVDRTDRVGRLWTADAVHASSLANLHGDYATVVDTRAAIAAATMIAARRKTARPAG